MEAHLSLLLLLSCFAAASYAHNVHLSTLNQSLIVNTTTTPPGQVLKAGVDRVTITWAYNLTYPGTEANYSTVEAKLCYAPVSQVGRNDRKTDDNLDVDKTCPFDITNGPYKRSNNSFVWTIPKDTPTATYFVRVYVLKSNNHEIAYGDSTGALKTTGLIQVDGVISEEKVSAAWAVSGNSFGSYAWLLMLFLIMYV